MLSRQLVARIRTLAAAGIAEDSCVRSRLRRSAAALAAVPDDRAHLSALFET
jgi:nicotinamidase-related amidase